MEAWEVKRGFCKGLGVGRREGAFEEGVEETIVVAEDKRSGFKNFRSLLNSGVESTSVQVL